LLLRLDIKTAIGTSLLVIIPTALVGAGKHYQLGHVNGRVAVALMWTAVVGGFLGAWLTKYLHSDDLKRAFGGFLVLVGLRLVLWR
jgi:uncharacterized membrane protein YfcA